MHKIGFLRILNNIIDNNLYKKRIIKGRLKFITIDSLKLLRAGDTRARNLRNLLGSIS